MPAVTLSRRHDFDPQQEAVVVPFPRSAVDPDMLRVAFDDYRGVMACVARAEVTPKVALVRARLTRLLLQDGWEPPVSVLDQLRSDEELLADLRLASVS
jgi:hypothetical protein